MRRPSPELIDGDNPEWTDKMFARAIPFSGLPQELQNLLSSAEAHQARCGDIGGEPARSLNRAS
jgi:hypothetical protein